MRNEDGIPEWAHGENGKNVAHLQIPRTLTKPQGNGSLAMEENTFCLHPLKFDVLYFKLKVDYEFLSFIFVAVLLAKTKRTKGWLALRGMWG